MLVHSSCFILTDSRNRSTTPKDSIELLSDNRPLPVSEVRVNQTLQYPVRQTFHFKVSSANTIKSENIQRPNITLVNASSLTLQRARIGSAFGRVLMRLRHEKVSSNIPLGCGYGYAEIINGPDASNETATDLELQVLKFQIRGSLNGCICGGSLTFLCIFCRY